MFGQNSGAHMKSVSFHLASPLSLLWPELLGFSRSTLSQVIHAVAALLYPFTWQHTLISIVPEILIDVVMAPTPYLLGVQKRLLDQVTDQSDVSNHGEHDEASFKAALTGQSAELLLSVKQLLVVDLSADKKKTFIVSVKASSTWNTNFLCPTHNLCKVMPYCFSRLVTKARFCPRSLKLKYYMHWVSGKRDQVSKAHSRAH